jgi:Xaa-Pro aminopeptidase
MPEYGFMSVDWEERIDFSRLRRERLAKAKAALEASDLDMLLVFRLEDVRYLTGLRTHNGPTTIMSQAAVVLPRGGEPILYALDHEHAKARMPWLNKELVFDRPNVRTTDGTKDWLEHVRSLVGSKLDGKVGVDAWTMEMDLAHREALPNTQFCDGYKVLMDAKIIKTEDEVECHRAATMITEAGMDAALRVLRPGIRECEVLAEAWKTFTALGSEWSQCSNIVASGPYTAPYRRFTSDRIIRAGDMVIMDIGAGFNGYWGDFTRTFICGDMEPTKEQKALHQESYNTLFNALDTSRVGNTNYDVWKCIQNEHSNAMSGGHGAGTSPWEPPWLSGYTKGGTMPLRPGMLFSIEPYAGIPGIGGFRLENQLVVREEGPEIYTTYPFDHRLLTDIHPLDKTTGRSTKLPIGTSPFYIR